MEELFPTILIPALDEEENVGSAVLATLSAFDRLGIPGEIVVIDDGSTDGTKDVVDRIAAGSDRVRILSHDSPRGIGASFWDGVDLARGNVVCLLPADNEADAEEILRYLPLLEHVDIVIPFVFNKEVRSLFRNGLSFVYRFIINTTFLVNFNYTNGTVLSRKSILEEIGFRSTSFFYQTDILVRCVKKGYLFAEVPYRLASRTSGKSKGVSFPSFLQVVRGYLRLVKDTYHTRGQKVPRVFAAGSQTARRRGERPRAAPPPDGGWTETRSLP